MPHLRAYLLLMNEKKTFVHNRWLFKSHMSDVKDKSILAAVSAIHTKKNKCKSDI